MRRRVSVLVLAVLCTLPGAQVAQAAATEWHSETPVAAGIGVPAPLGEVGDMAFWAPNRGILITAGSRGMPAGVYAYDGTDWHLYSSVCGGHEGSVAWAGPDDFWTVADYASEPEGVENPTSLRARTLCHFDNGEVVASYAEPYGSPTAYAKMEAAACSGSGDCWFAGAPLPESSPNPGPFHLHWDGSSLIAIPSLEEPQPQIEDPLGTVTSMSFLGGNLFEAAEEAPYLREVSLARPEVFAPVATPEGTKGPFKLSGDGGQLWAIGQDGESVLRSIGAGFEAIPIESHLGFVAAVAAEPAGAAAWVGGRAGQAATVTRVTATGKVSATATLPDPSEELDAKGAPAAMACPALGQCWMVTEKGWLFHLGGSLPQDTDPAMHAFITYRPSDNSTRSFVPAGVPEDNSGEGNESDGFEERSIEKLQTAPKPRTLVAKVRRKIIGKRTLELTFVLRARAYVQLLAKYHRKIVAKTRRSTMGKGPHKLRLKLNPKRWPTGLDFRVHPAGKRSA